MGPARRTGLAVISFALGKSHVASQVSTIRRHAGWLLLPRALLGLISTSVLITAPMVWADVLILKSGGRIQGEWLNVDQRPRNEYVVRTRDGVRLILAAAQVMEVIRERPALEDYARIAPTYADTPEDQRQLAEWCRERHLGARRQTHLRRILELDPHDLRARRSLGYRKLGGHWYTEPEWMRHQGYRFHQGRWRLPQEIELSERNQQIEATQGSWQKKLRKCREELDSGHAQEARRALLAIRDPLAVPALQEMFSAESWRAVKTLYVEVFLSIGSPGAWKSLVGASLDDPDQEVRMAALDAIVRVDPPGAIHVYVDALEDQNNHRVNRAAYALAQLNKPSAVRPLIQALVTRHRFKIGGAGDPQAVSTSFSDAGSSFSTGGQPTIVQREVRNQEVLHALVVLSGGVNFSFDREAWNYWHDAWQGHDSVDLR